MIAAPWLFWMAVGYTVVFTIGIGGMIIIGIAMLRNFQLIIFRSLGRQYVLSLLVIAGLLHLLNLVAVWVIALNSELVVYYASGSITGLKLWLMGILCSLYCGRQFALARLFGTFGSMSKLQAFWPPVILASLLWIPIIICYYLSLDFYLTSTVFISMAIAFYLCYVCLFAYLSLKNRKITRLFSDYVPNMIVFAFFIVYILLGGWLSVQYQVFALDTYRSEMGMTYILGLAALTSLLVTLLPRFLTWKRHPEFVKEWEEFNQKNGFLYGGLAAVPSRLEMAVSELRVSS